MVNGKSVSGSSVVVAVAEVSVGVQECTWRTLIPPRRTKLHLLFNLLSADELNMG